MNKNVIERTINGVLVHVPTELETYYLSKKESSNVDYFGHNINASVVEQTDHNFWIQFKGGKGSYVFSKVSVELIIEASKADSIGSFFAKNIKGKFESTAVDYRVELAK